MSESIRKTFINALKKLMNEKDVNQKELAKAIGVSPTTINNWVNGYNVPRMDKIDLLASYFRVERTELIGMPEESYFLDTESQKIADDIKNNKQLKLLFSAARDVSPENLELAHQMLLALKRKEKGEID